MTWVRVNDDTGAVNLDRVAALGVRDQGDGEYVISFFTDASLASGTAVGNLTGTYGSLPSAQAALARLVDAVDPTTYGD